MSEGPKAGALELVKPERLTPHPKNIRQHTQDQIERIKKSIQAFGFTAPILANSEYVILAGHGRHKAASELKLDRIPVIRLSNLTPEEELAYLIADNKHTDNSYFNLPDLKSLMLELDTGAIDMTLTGFSQAELADLLGSTGGAEKDAPEEEAELPVARIGDIWRLADSYLVVGRSSERTDRQVCEDADMVLKAWQKTAKTKAVLHSTDSNLIDQLV